MTLALTEEQVMIRDVARRFAERDVEPLANDIDREDRVPAALHAKAVELDLFGLYTPEDYGGAGQNLTTSCLVLEEIARASPAYAGLISVEIVLCPAAIALIGNEDQKRRWLPESASGERLFAWSSTEPAGAGNMAAHQSRIEPDGNGYRLNGHKLFCTQGNADRIMVMAKTRRDGHEGYGCVIVERDMPGVEVQRHESKLGWRGTNTGPIAFNDVFVPAENQMGDLLTGMADVYPANVVSCIAHSATSLGCAQGLFDKTLVQVRERNLYGLPMHALQPVSYWMAEAYAKLAAMRSLLYASTARWDAGDHDVLLSAVCKGWICDTAFDVTHRLLQLWGGSGIMDSTGVNRYLRDARTNMIAEGASEMHYAHIAHHLFSAEETA